MSKVLARPSAAASLLMFVGRIVHGTDIQGRDQVGNRINCADGKPDPCRVRVVEHVKLSERKYGTISGTCGTYGTDGVDDNNGQATIVGGDIDAMNLVEGDIVSIMWGGTDLVASSGGFVLPYARADMRFDGEYFVGGVGDDWTVGPVAPDSGYVEVIKGPTVRDIMFYTVIRAIWTVGISLVVVQEPCSQVLYVPSLIRSAEYAPRPIIRDFAGYGWFNDFMWFKTSGCTDNQEMSWYEDAYGNGDYDLVYKVHDWLW